MLDVKTRNCKIEKQNWGHISALLSLSSFLLLFLQVLPRKQKSKTEKVQGETQNEKVYKLKWEKWKNKKNKHLDTATDRGLAQGIIEWKSGVENMPRWWSLTTWTYTFEI